MVATDAEAGDPALPSLTSDGDPVQWSVQSGSNGQVLIGTAVGSGAYHGQVVAKLELTSVSTGACKFTLLGPIDHPDANQSGTADQIGLTFSYTIKDGSGDTATNTLTINVKDDAPVAHDYTQTGPSSTSTNTNLLLILDVSGSMATASGVTNLTRLDLEKAAAYELLEQYGNLGDVAVRIVTFSTGTAAAGSVWMTRDQAKTYISGLTAGGAGNYDTALGTAQSAFASTGKIVGADNVAYFMSDGQPNPVSAGIDASEQTAWENFLNSNDIKSYALGLGTGLSTTNLDPIAYDGTTATQVPSLLVTDPAQLGATITPTIAPPVVGNILTNAADSFGADQPGFVKSIAVNGTTYTYNPVSETVTASGGTNHGSFNASTHVLTVSTSLNGVFKIDLQSSAYTYQPANGLTQPITETINYKISDQDGDSSGGNTLILNVTDTDSPPIARDDLVITNAAGSGITVTIPDAALLYNDDVNGQGITLTGPTNISAGDAATHLNSQFTFTDSSTNGGAFHYNVANQANSSLNDDGLVTINRLQAGSATLSGSGLDDVLIGNPGAASTLNGYEGKDYLIGGNLNDTLIGGAGEDVLSGGKGNDTLTGGTGHDLLRFTINDINPSSPQTDTITDFTIGTTANSDDLALSQILTGLSSNPSAVELNNYLKFSVSGSHTVLQIDTDGSTGGATVDHTVQFQNTSLYTQYGVNASSANANTDLINQMLAQHNLLIS